MDSELDELLQEARNDQFKVASLLLTVAAELVTRSAMVRPGRLVATGATSV
jgi:hypothetical protein